MRSQDSRRPPEMMSSPVLVPRQSFPFGEQSCLHGTERSVWVRDQLSPSEASHEACSSDGGGVGV